MQSRILDKKSSQSLYMYAGFSYGMSLTLIEILVKWIKLVIKEK